MEEMLNKFIDEGKREHEETRVFIYDFQTTNELLFKERNISLIGLRFGVQELLKVINNVPMIDCDVKGVTTRVELENPVGPNDILTNDQPQMTSEPVVQPSNKVQTPPVPFPRRLRKEKEEAQQRKFLENLKQLHINLPFIEALAQMPKYAKFLKDLGASISLMTYMMYKKLGLGEPKATRISLELADRFRHPRYARDSRVLIILRRPFLETARAMIDVFNKKITLRVGDDEVIFDELLENDEPDSFLSRGLEKSIHPSDLECCESASSDGNNESDLENSIQRIDSANTPYPNPELKNLPQHLEYVNLHGDKSFPITMSFKLSEKQKNLLLHVLEKRIGAIAWKMSDIKGISPSYCTYKILMEDDYKPVIQPQRHLNPKFQDVVKNKIVKLLDSGLIYPISDSSWVSLIHVVPNFR
ncbi:hypothetical protein Tco_1130851 [Tanacetum coccineum]